MFEQLSTWNWDAKLQRFSLGGSIRIFTTQTASCCIDLPSPNIAKCHCHLQELGAVFSITGRLAAENNERGWSSDRPAIGGEPVTWHSPRLWLVEELGVQTGGWHGASSGVWSGPGIHLQTDTFYIPAFNIRYPQHTRSMQMSTNQGGYNREPRQWTKGLIRTGKIFWGLRYSSSPQVQQLWQMIAFQIGQAIHSYWSLIYDLYKAIFTTRQSSHVYCSWARLPCYQHCTITTVAPDTITPSVSVMETKIHLSWRSVCSH